VADICSYCRREKLPCGEKLHGPSQNNHEQNVATPGGRLNLSYPDVSSLSIERDSHPSLPSSSIVSSERDQPALSQALVLRSTREMEPLEQPEEPSRTTTPNTEGPEERLGLSPNLSEMEEPLEQPEELSQTTILTTEGPEERLDLPPNLSEVEEPPFPRLALPPTKDAELDEPHQPWGATQFWDAKMDKNSQWEGMAVPSYVIKRRYDINWKNPLGRGTFGRVLEVRNSQYHVAHRSRQWRDPPRW